MAAAAARRRREREREREETDPEADAAARRGRRELWNVWETLTGFDCDMIPDNISPNGDRAGRCMRQLAG